VQRHSRGTSRRYRVTNVRSARAVEVPSSGEFPRPWWCAACLHRQQRDRRPSDIPGWPDWSAARRPPCRAASR
jgi:hypothetical protein